MLEYAHIEYENKKYAAGGAPDFSRECWLSEKFTLNLDFPNLPYLIDGDVRITQSNACYRYIARKAGLYGKTEKEMALADMCADQVMDFRNDVITVSYAWSESCEKKVSHGVSSQTPDVVRKISLEQDLARRRLADLSRFSSVRDP